MKEDSWSIRKMREMQKYSTTRNTYKYTEPDAEQENLELNKQENDGMLIRFYQRLSLFLEE